jgi:riboflavin kinase/FMN adenylyltransferase
MTTFHSHNIDSDFIPSDLQNGVVAIGNFDGLHRGHRTIVDKTLAMARNNNCPSILLCFDPHPRTWFNPANPVYLLTPPDMKSALAAGLGISAMAIHTFNDAFSSLSAEDFVVKILIEKLRAKHVVTGEDFHFGKKRQGTPQFLMEAGKTHGFGVTFMPACKDESGKIISSSRIRKHLEDGKLGEANKLLGYPYQISGTVIIGQKIGRTLGFPTANLELPASVRLKYGIYAVRVIRENGDRFDGVANFGRRPTFDNGRVLFETYLFDFDGNLYGEEITIELYDWQRDEEKFDSSEELVDQMMIDKQLTRQFFSKFDQEG